MASRSPIPRSIDRLIRAVLCLCILWASATACRAAWDLFRPVPQARPPERTDALLPPFLGGEWRMRHGGLRVAASTLDAAALDARFKLAARPGTGPTTEFERMLLSWFDTLAGSKGVFALNVASSGDHAFLLNEVRLRYSTSVVAGERRLGLAQAAWPSAAGAWELVEIEAASQQGSVPTSTATGFAELIATGGETVAERHQPGEGTTGVCVVRPPSVEKLAKAWERAGFRVQVDSVGASASVLQGVREGMHVWGLHASNGDANNSFLLLLR